MTTTRTCANGARIRPAMWPAAAVSAVLVAAGFVSAGAEPVVAQSSSPPASYTLADTWPAEPWELTAGAHWWIVDAADAPDGRRWLLDTRADTGGLVVHVFAPDGTPESVFNVEGRLDRFDVDAHGRVQTLETTTDRDGNPRCLVRIHDAGGGEVRRHSWPLAEPNECADIAAGPDGETYLLFTPEDGKQHSGNSGLIVFNDRRQLGWVSAESLYPVDHDQPDHIHPVFTSVDVMPDGAIYVGMYFPGCG